MSDPWGDEDPWAEDAVPPPLHGTIDDEPPDDVPPALTRADAARAVAMYSALGKAADAQAKRYRSWLDDGAVAEMERDGSAPKGEIPGLGSWALKLTADRIDVTDASVLFKWVQENHPEQIKTVPKVEIVQPAYVTYLVKTVEHLGGGAVALPETGEVVPGLRFVAGGKPAGVAVTPKASERQRLADAASRLLAMSGVPELPGGAS